MHPLDRLSKKVHYFGWYQKVLGRARRSIQPLYGWAFVMLVLMSGNLYAPLPFKLFSKQVIYLEPNNPSHLSLHNSAPDIFRIESKIDMSWKPDIL
jgi:hypothetical protein